MRAPRKAASSQRRGCEATLSVQPCASNPSEEAFRPGLVPRGAFSISRCNFTTACNRDSKARLISVASGQGRSGPSCGTTRTWEAPAYSGAFPLVEQQFRSGHQGERTCSRHPASLKAAWPPKPNVWPTMTSAAPAQSLLTTSLHLGQPPRSADRGRVRQLLLWRGPTSVSPLNGAWSLSDGQPNLRP